MNHSSQLSCIVVVNYSSKLSCIAVVNYSSQLSCIATKKLANLIRIYSSRVSSMTRGSKHSHLRLDCGLRRGTPLCHATSQLPRVSLPQQRVSSPLYDDYVTSPLYTEAKLVSPIYQELPSPLDKSPVYFQIPSPVAARSPLRAKLQSDVPKYFTFLSYQVQL